MKNNVQENLINLLTTIRNAPDVPEDWKEDDIKNILQCVEKFPHYYNSVITMNNEIRMARDEGYEPEYIRELTQELDATRRNAHISMTIGQNMIERNARAYNCEPVFGLGILDIDNPQDRDRAARAGFEYTANTMLSIIGKESLPEHEPGRPYEWKEYDAAMTSIIQGHGMFIERAPSELREAAEL